jgi:hypothetical protein
MVSVVFWLQKPSVLRVCVREEDAEGREVAADAHSILIWTCFDYDLGVSLCLLLKWDAQTMRSACLLLQYLL